MQNAPIMAPTADTPERRAFYDRIDKKNSDGPLAVSRGLGDSGAKEPL